MATVNDVVLIYLEDAPVSFARIEHILPDAKKDWYQIKLLMLKIPLQMVTWILKDDYINGAQFHMNGKKMKIEKVQAPVEEVLFSQKGDPAVKKLRQTDNPGKENQAQIISFPDLKKNHEPESG